MAESGIRAPRPLTKTCALSQTLPHSESREWPREPPPRPKPGPPLKARSGATLAAQTRPATRPGPRGEETEKTRGGPGGRTTGRTWGQTRGRTDSRAGPPSLFGNYLSKISVRGMSARTDTCCRGRPLRNNDGHNRRLGENLSGATTRRRLSCQLCSPLPAHQMCHPARSPPPRLWPSSLADGPETMPESVVLPGSLAWLLFFLSACRGSPAIPGVTIGPGTPLPLPRPPQNPKRWARC